jgi:glycosyltransferase involved in cell wall biosynthesis
LRWLGFLDEQAKPAALASAQCFVHASESEGMALAILEAMSAGLPVVASKGCYMREAAAAGALLECAQGPEALADAIRRVLDDASLAATLGKNARVHAAQEHDWDRIAARTLEIYSK